MVPPTLFIIYVVGCNSWQSSDRLENYAAATLIMECIIFSALYVYGAILKNNEEVCEDTGTAIGALVMAPIYLASSICALFAILVAGGYAVNYIAICLKRICCCCGGTVLMGSNLAKIPYDANKFRDSTTDCAICLNSFCKGEKVSPLHCDIKHVFHTACIKKWLVRNPVCPLCKATIEPEKLKRFNKDLKSRLAGKEEDKECLLTKENIV